MKYTEEQQAIIEGSTDLEVGDIMKVNACAGSGKTSTCVGVAEANPDKLVLYLVFNKNMQEEAKKKFPNNVTVKTIHSLAYYYTMYNNGENGKPVRTLRNKDYNVQELADILIKEKIIQDNLNGKNLAFSLKRCMDGFYNSEYTDIEEYAKKFHSNMRAQTAVRFYQLLTDGKIDVTHSAYLKEFHILIKNNPMLLTDICDMIILDEAQDTNPVTWEIIKNTKTPLICVGDTNQNIYGFRETFNVMENIEAKKEFKLTYNFRSNQNILDRANSVIEVFKGKDDYKMISKAKFSDGNDIKNEAIITRTNAKIVDILIKSLKGEMGIDKINLPRGVDSVFEYIVEYDKWRNTGKVSNISYKWLEKFKNEDDLKTNYIDKGLAEDEPELKATIQMIDKYEGLYGKNIIREAYEYALKKSFEPVEKDTVNLLTAHTSKGLEFDKVTLTSDYRPLADIYSQIGKAKPGKQRDDDMKAYTQEVNLAYVAFTRARKVLIDRSPLLENMMGFKLYCKDLEELKKDKVEQKVKVADKEVVIPQKIAVTHRSKRKKQTFDNDIGF